MKYGAHSFIFTERWSDDKLGILDQVKRLGLDCFDIGVGDDVLFGPKLTREKAEGLGIELTISPGGLWPTECDLSSENPSMRRLGLEWHKKQIDLAGELGATAYSGALYGHPGTVKREVPPAGAEEWTAEGLALLAEYGQALGVVVVIEAMSHFRTHVANTPGQIMNLIDIADHANLLALFDTYHLITEVRDYRQAIHTFGDRLWGIHACESDRGKPGGGLVPWQSVFLGLAETSFDGYVIFESYNSSEGDFAIRRGMFHDVCPDANVFVTDALEFMRLGFGDRTAD